MADIQINNRCVTLGSQRSVIRELFEYGNMRKAQIGEENVFDYSLGNPSVAPPAEFFTVMEELIRGGDPVALYGYTSAQGAKEVREAVADYINGTYGNNVTADGIYMTCGAAAGLAISLCALCNEGDEVITPSPYFPEYEVFANTAGARLVKVPVRLPSFSLDTEAVGRAITPRTKAVIINSPNNPTGAVYTAEEIARLSALLRECSEKLGRPIWLISDEPYRELVYGGEEVPYIMNYYADSIVCYSFSKSLSLPGERIGYLALNRRAENAEEVYAAICGAGRALGYVCAPSLMQRVTAKLLGKTADISVYERNRDRLCSILRGCGFNVVTPRGAFYLFVQSPEPSAEAFSKRAMQYELLLVPGDGFGCGGYVRIASCVSPELIERSVPAFCALASSYGLNVKQQ